MQKKVIINRGDLDIRVAFLEDGKLVEFHREALNERSIVGNIYRGVVQDVIPGLQAAFIDVGLKRNMFLHFMDIRPEALVMTAPKLEEALEEAGKKVLPGRIMLRGRRPRPDLKNVGEAPVKRGDTIIVQVVKEGISEKAARVTSNVTLAGRYLVLLPFPSQTGGVSRRVAMGQERLKLKKLLHDLKTEQHSFIVRTAGVTAEEEQVRSDVDLLLEQWRTVVERFRELKRPGLVFSDQDIVHRLVRDAFSTHIDEVIVDDEDIAEALRSTLQNHLPELAGKVRDYDDREPIFERYDVEQQLRKALHRKVWLKSGGYLIVDEMEALTAIDVNTGRFTGSRDQEKTSFRTNMEACEAVAQQIRLRDIGGIIVVDFIDMLSQDNQARVAEEFRRHMRHDRAKNSIGRIGDFGLMVLTRKRRHQSLLNQVFDDCPYCSGEGMVLRPGEVWRRMQSDLLVLLEKSGKYAAAVITCDPGVAEILQSEYAPLLETFESEQGVRLIVRADSRVHREAYQLTGVEKPKHAPVSVLARRIPQEEAITEPVAWEDVPELAEPAEPEEVAAEADAALEKETPATEGDEAEQPEGARRTRRGRRGGRRRRRKADVQDIESAEGADAEEESEEPTEVGSPEDNVPVPHKPKVIEIAPPPAPAASPRQSAARPVPSPKPSVAAPAVRSRGIQVIAQWGSSKEAPERPAAKSPVAETRPAAPVAPTEPAASRPKRVQVLGVWGSRGAGTPTTAAPDKTASAKQASPAPAAPQAKAAETGKRPPRPPRQKQGPSETVEAAVQEADPAKASVAAGQAAEETQKAGRPRRRTRPPRREAAAAEPAPAMAKDPAVSARSVSPRRGAGGRASEGQASGGAAESQSADAKAAPRKATKKSAAKKAVKKTATEKSSPKKAPAEKAAKKAAKKSASKSAKKSSR